MMIRPHGVEVHAILSRNVLKESIDKEGYSEKIPGALEFPLLDHAKKLNDISEAGNGNFDKSKAERVL